MSQISLPKFDWDLTFLQNLAGPAGFVARGLMAEVFISEGYSKIVAYNDTAQYMQSFGVSPLLLPLVILTELGGGLLILLGFKTRWAAVALFGFAILTALLFHNNISDYDQWLNFQKNLAIAGGYLTLAIAGPGGWSIDAWRSRFKP